MDTPTQPSESSEPPAVDLLPLPSRLGDYELTAALGAGGMGVVYRARHRSLQSTAAVKVLNPAIAHHTTARQRFLQEARLTAGLRHDGVVRVVHVGEDGPVLFLVMELLEGESLTDRLKRGPAFTTDETVRIGREVASALAEAHRQNLVHRDIKPGNIFLQHIPGRPPRVKLLDFGIARRQDADQSFTSVHALIGTPHYMAPEQVDDSRVGSPADVFSLGCVLYELVSGRNPFRGRSQAASLRLIAEYDPPPLNELFPILPDAFSTVVRDCLFKDPLRRPTAEDVERRLLQVEPEPDSRTALRTVSAAADTTETQKYRPNAKPTARRWVGAFALLIALGTLGCLGLWLDSRPPKPKADDANPVADRPLPVADKSQSVLSGWRLEQPPPLDEWLRGRRIRTVRQDGGAEFRSLLAALAAVRSGEAIEILDAGPYTDFAPLPDGSVGLSVPPDVTDIGIFSRTGASLRTTKYQVNKNIPPKNGRVCYAGATIAAGAGLRLHGLTFQADPPPQNTADASAWRLSIGGPCVVEDCLWLRAAHPRPEQYLVILAFDFRNSAAMPLTVRRCWVEGTVNTHVTNPGVRTEARIERCVFTDASQNLWLQLGHARWAFLENIFQADDCCVALGTTRFAPAKGQPEVLFGRNTFLSTARSPVRVERYEKGELAKVSVALFDNAFSGPGEPIHFAASQDARESRSWASQENWSTDHSGAAWLNFLEGRIQFVSQDPLAPDFARIENSPPGTGGAGLRGPGAVPSGPLSDALEWLAYLQARRGMVSP
ncbi:serine/threonine-protein kinase [Limnoglobus roseus]|uniref:Serine/threonine protein kinase n=1 Tax=Limnoglobus roseus TaxID=2598579 RepID=A0A5C1ADP7_9BACT|nr:serine/threonine-protein kinase [Limnoglobus roseus]QEL16363.1 serine/threonine protein kinase [Limnoglobus roseus]